MAADRRAGRDPGHRRRLPPAADHRVLDDPDGPSVTTSAAASLRRVGADVASARARTSTSSAAPTRPDRPRCTCRRGQVGHHVVRGPSLEAVDVPLPDPADRGHRNITVRTCTEVVDAVGDDDHLTGLGCSTSRPARPRRSTCAGCAASSAPRHAPTGSTAWWPATTTASCCPGRTCRNVCGWTLERPPHHLETSVPGVFVAGDVRAESAKRVAAAVGEGSMAVMLVHRYLAEA